MILTVTVKRGGTSASVTQHFISQCFISDFISILIVQVGNIELKRDAASLTELMSNNGENIMSDHGAAAGRRTRARKSDRLVSHGETSQHSSALSPITEEPLGSGSDVLRQIQGKYSPHVSSDHFQIYLFVSIFDDRCSFCSSPVCHTCVSTFLCLVSTPGHPREDSERSQFTADQLRSE